MAQNDRLENLVNEVERESRQFATFDDYLNSQNQETECRKDASDAVENSSSRPSEKAAEMDESSKPSSAEPVTELTEEEKAAAHAEYLKNQAVYIEKGAKTEPLAHPVAPNVTAEEPPVKVAQEAPITTTRLEVHGVDWAGAHSSYVSEVTEVDTSEPDWWKGVFFAGKKFALETADLSEVIKHYHTLEEAIKKIKRSQQGLRAGLEEKLHGATSEQRAKLKDLDKDYRQVTNQKSAARMKVERAEKPKVNPNFKLVDTMNEVMGLDQDEILAQLEAKGKLDAETKNYVSKKFGGAK